MGVTTTSTYDTAMANFAQIDDGNIVTNIIVADQDFIDTGALGDPSEFKEYGPALSNGLKVAAIGYEYDQTFPAFIPPKPYPSWLLNTEIFVWEPPTPDPNADGHEKCPDGGEVIYMWDENTLSWVALPCPPVEGEG